MLSTVLEVAGLAFLVIAAAFVHPAFGVAALGAALLLVGFFVEDSA